MLGSCEISRLGHSFVYCFLCTVSIFFSGFLGRPNSTRHDIVLWEQWTFGHCCYVDRNHHCITLRPRSIIHKNKTCSQSRMGRSSNFCNNGKSDFQMMFAYHRKLKLPPVSLLRIHNPLLRCCNQRIRKPSSRPRTPTSSQSHQMGNSWPNLQHCSNWHKQEFSRRLLVTNRHPQDSQMDSVVLHFQHIICLCFLHYLHVHAMHAS